MLRHPSRTDPVRRAGHRSRIAVMREERARRCRVLCSWTAFGVEVGVYAPRLMVDHTDGAVGDTPWRVAAGGKHQRRRGGGALPCLCIRAALALEQLTSCAVLERPAKDGGWWVVKKSGRTGRWTCENLRSCNWQRGKRTAPSADGIRSTANRPVTEGALATSKQCNDISIQRVVPPCSLTMPSVHSSFHSLLVHCRDSS